MKIICGVYLFFTLLAYGSTKILNQRSNEKISGVDALIEALQHEVWDADEVPCLDTTLALLNGVKNSTLWATWILDANQHPTGLLYGSSHQLGNFDQCLHPPWLETHPHLKTQYCTADVTLTPKEPEKITRNWDPYEDTENYINTESKHGIQFTRIYWGVCVPASCREHSVAKLLRCIYSTSQFTPLAAAEPNVSVHYCQVAGADYHYPTEFFLFLAMIALLLTTMLVSTFYKSDMDKENGGTIGSMIARSFCFKRNYNSLISMPSEIPTLDGIKFFTALCAVVAHQVLITFRMPIINNLDFDKSADTGVMKYLAHLDVVVDTFFAVSAALHMKGLMDNAGKGQNILSVQLKRYLRFLGPLAVTIFYLTSVAEHTGTGPVWQKHSEDERTVCSKYGIYTLLMLNASVKYSCNLITWYLSCDYQLSILGAVIFYVYSKNKKRGYTAFAISSVLAVLIPGLMTYWHRLQVIPLFEIPDLVDPRNAEYLKCNASRIYIRAGPYLVGIALGYILSIYKPNNYRKVITKKISVIGTITCLVVMYHILTLSAYMHDTEYNIIEAAVLAASNRAVWAFCVCCFIAFCEYGTVPIVSELLSVKLFTPFSRLSYGIYLIHMLVVERNVYSTRTPVLFDIFQFAVTSAGVFLLTCFFSFIFWFLVEAPWNNLINRLLNKSKEDRVIKEDENGNCALQNGSKKHT